MTKLRAPSSDDVANLLRPISVESPAGKSLRYEPVYTEIREARRKDDATIPPGAWERPLKAADYGICVALCVDALTHQSKDLQIAAWLADAWTKLHGLVGLTRGLELVTGLAARFFDTMFPAPSEEAAGDDARSHVFDWLDDNLAQRLDDIPIGDDRTELSLGLLRTLERGSSDGGVPSDTVDARLSMIGPERWLITHRDLAAALNAARALEANLTSRASVSASLRRVKAALDRLFALASDALRRTGGDASPLSAVESGVASATFESASPATGSGNVVAAAFIRSRAEAYRRLTEASDYLLHTEPHSPVPYLVKRAISWGNLSLTELLQELITDSQDLVKTHELLGMRRRNDE